MKEPILDDAIVFFDLAGTLVETDGEFTNSGRETLRLLIKRVKKIVLVTGQPADDPQVHSFLNIFKKDDHNKIVAYVTRGGARLKWSGESFITDESYSAAILDTIEQESIKSIARSVLAEMELKPFIPVQTIDEVAVRINLEPDKRPSLVKVLSGRLQEEGFFDLQVLPEGRTSVFITKRGIGKKMAIDYELKLAGEDGCGYACFFGNEMTGNGNDREAMEIKDLDVFALGPCDPIPDNSKQRTIGQTPNDLYICLQSWLDHHFLGASQLPVVCISLGGTKIEIGALTHHGVYLSSPEIKWRDSPEFAGDEIQHFCSVLIESVNKFLKRRGYKLSDAETLGVAFPGPQRGGRWFSTNLPKFFHDENGGANLEEELSKIIKNGPKPEVKVIFDAQCDAGGEVYHAQGRLRFDSTAVVVNLATGIAAGLVKNGRVLIDNNDFRNNLGQDYDNGAGQIGRHLWYSEEKKQWNYHYRSGGRIPNRSTAGNSSIRMTNRLSGPALAARILREFNKHGLPLEVIKFCDHVELQFCENVAQQEDLEDSVIMMRRAEGALSGRILSWADGAYGKNEPKEYSQIIQMFAHEIAKELAEALNLWLSQPKWQDFKNHIILTGKAGSHFLVSADNTNRSFLTMLRDSLPANILVERSQLHCAAERESYLFHYQERDEIKLSRQVVDWISGKIQVNRHSKNSIVDAKATNQELILHGRSLSNYEAMTPGSNLVLNEKRIDKQLHQHAPSKLVTIMLAGGSSFRSGGQIHPLRRVQDPNTGVSKTLLQWRLYQLSQSPLSDSPVIIVSSPQNQVALTQHLDAIRNGHQTKLYSGGLAPCLSTHGVKKGFPVLLDDGYGRIAYSHLGHFEALRWLVLSGLLAELLNYDILFLCSYSNCGRIFDEKTLGIAGYLKKVSMQMDSTYSILVEVTGRLSTKKSGSCLMKQKGDSSNKLRLIKYNYGTGFPDIMDNESKFVLMSTNTWYISVSSLYRRLQDKNLFDESLDELLSKAKRGIRRSELSKIFDSAFPIPPQLIYTKTTQSEFIRIERDLDQLTLLQDSFFVKPVEVNSDRAVSVKKLDDLKSKEKSSLIFGKR